MIKPQKINIRMRKYIFFILPILFIACNGPSEKRLLKDGNKIIEKIEVYKINNKELPNSLNEVGIEEKLEGPIFYNKEDSSNYILWFGVSVGESMVYSSKTKRWEKE